MNLFKTVFLMSLMTGLFLVIGAFIVTAAYRILRSPRFRKRF